MNIPRTIWRFVIITTKSTFYTYKQPAPFHFLLPLYVPVTGPVVAQRVGSGIAPLFHDRGTRSEWVFSSTHRQQFTPGKDPVPIVQEAGWASGPVWTGEKFRPTGIRTPDHPALSQSLYWLTYPAHCPVYTYIFVFSCAASFIYPEDASSKFLRKL